jgi:hypothetical protein
MGNATWVCFDCRQAVRRPTHYRAKVPCPTCTQVCTCIGTKIPIPPKCNTRAWTAFRKQFTLRTIAAADLKHHRKVRERHHLEQQIKTIESRPKTPGRIKLVRSLKRQLHIPDVFPANR